MASSLVRKQLLLDLLFIFLFMKSIAEESALFLPMSAGEMATIKCTPTQATQDGVLVYRFLHGQQEVSYLYKDTTFSPKGPYKGRLNSTKDVNNFSLVIHNMTVRDSGIYWCKFNKEEVESLSEERYLIVVSGKDHQCPSGEEESFHTFIIVCAVTAASMVLLIITVVLLWRIPKMKRCGEHGSYTPSQPIQTPTPNSEYEIMHRPRQFINPEYESSSKEWPL